MGGDGKKEGITLCQQGEPPSGPSEKGTQCVCSLMPSRGDLGSLDLHTRLGTSGLRKSGWGIRWTALEERGNPQALAHRSFPFLNLPLRGASKGGLGTLAAPLIERLRLSWESSFLPGLLQPPLAPSPESARSSQRSPPPLLPSQCHRGCLALPPSPPLAPCFRPSLSRSLPPFASSPFLPLGRDMWHSGSCSPLERGLAPPADPAGLHFPSSPATGTHSTRLRSHTQTHTHTSLSPSLFSLAAAAASVWLCLSSALLSPPFFLSVPRVRPPPPPRERRRRSVAIRGG